ncbi:4-galactosyl-N-acetylglucosaminide 3-alpha-L-fucosyltransferase FUT5-like [Discoglossus pictus]
MTLRQQNYVSILIAVILLLVFLISVVWNMHKAFPVVFSCQWANTTTDTSIKLPRYPHKPEQELMILVWVWPFGEHFPLDTCERDFGISGCQLTANRSMYDVANAVAVHHVDIMYEKGLLPNKPRPYFQRWVWFNLEPPLIIRNLQILDNLFNTTMTFRQDSDIYTPYGWIEPLKEPQIFVIPTKSKLVSWVVSKWYPGTPRIAYYEMLKKHITIDVYGKKHKSLSFKDFHQTLSQYKFYLAFENSIYKDYITEKLWRNALYSETVPIVLGTSRKNYERFLPGDAFIHVDDFSSPMELAHFLLELDKDDKRYKTYFNWRKYYNVRIDTGWPYYYCKLCKGLRQAPDFQVIPSIAKWYLEDTKF